MKVGIITVYSVDFGSYFQAMCLCRAIRALGFDCEIINENIRFAMDRRFHLLHIAATYLPRFLRAFLARAVPIFDKYLVLKRDIRTFDPFVSKPYASYLSASEDYDCTVIGSDELWNVANPGVKFTPAFFGLNLACPVISYAISAGSFCTRDPQDVHPDLRSKMREGWNNFSALSVRDDMTRRWVQDIARNESQIVLDPTLLNPYFLSDCVPCDDGYVIVYGQTFDPESIARAREFSQAQSLPLRSVSWPHRWCNDHISVRSAYELQQAFSKSSFSIVSTLHGTIFSILHQKPFVSVFTSVRGAKVKSLLAQLTLSHRLFDPGKPIAGHEPIDFEMVSEELKTLRQHSLDYLQQALDRLDSRPT